MYTRRYFPEQFTIAGHLLYRTLLIIPVSVAVGSLVAFFLWLLDMVTALRWANLWLVFLLPPAGIFISFLYRIWGKDAEAGNNLIIDEIHQPGGGVPVRMAPLIFVTTIVTHLFGGSAGREGTAVQIGGSMAALFSKWYRLSGADRRMLLMCGMAAGFGAVFGTPVTGAVFAMEVLAIGSIKYDALVPCFIASVLADITCAAYGIHHTHYAISFTEHARLLIPFVSFDIWLLIKVIGASVLFGLAAHLFAATAHGIKNKTATYIASKWLIPVAGGITIIGFSYALGTFDYLGLGVFNPTGGVSIVSAFSASGSHTWSWLWKLLLTAVTLGTGFKGGEVTPLFFIGATLGNTLATLTGSPVDLFAALGFIAVFAGATNTPVACIFMGIELFGSHHVIYYAAACFTAYYFSGPAGIYGSQRTAVSKFHITRLRENNVRDHPSESKRTD